VKIRKYGRGKRERRGGGLIKRKNIGLVLSGKVCAARGKNGTRTGISRSREGGGVAREKKKRGGE